MWAVYVCGLCWVFMFVILLAVPPREAVMANPPPEAFDPAGADLLRFAGLLQGAGRADADRAEIMRSLENYWRDHEPALRAGAAALSEEVRLQSIARLVKWQEQLAAQRELRQSTTAIQVDEDYRMPRAR